MYLTLRDRPEGGQASGRRVKQRVASTVVLLGLVSLFTDISSESVNAVLPIYLTTVLGMSALAYGFIDGIYQGMSAVVRSSEDGSPTAPTVRSGLQRLATQYQR
jgi:hypothetical protein